MIKNWGDWETVRRQVALCGRVVDRHGMPLGNARVTIVGGPKQFEVQAKASAAAARALGDEHVQRDVAETKPDGIYFFMDLPEGDYTVAAEDPHTGDRGESRGRVACDQAGNVRKAVADIRLSSK
jgi:hypothetical protein